MEPTARRDDELAQQAPLVPDIGRADGPRTDGGRERTGRPRPTMRTPPTDSTDRQAYDDELAQEAPVVPYLGRPDRSRTDDTTDT
ncbi:hypothetical protein [Haloplanus natans]|uniref:hypothetical protein n=1 Tax=Haloplanus natans TaxID=376171 RepID=UPI000677B6BF|nr:hypothetical protein [Haloplanus natans]